MKQFWQEVLTLPYTDNHGSKHEKVIKSLLEKHGFTIITKKQFSELYSSDWNLLPEKYGVFQPFNSQKSPDFRVKNNGKFVDIECKSSKKEKPTYNSGLPKRGVVYVFTSKKYNETTIYFAEDVVSDHKRKLYAQLVEDLNAVLKTYQVDDAWQDDERGFDFYIRNMYTQSGGQSKTDYFTHPDRQRCETNVLDFNW